MNGNSTYSNGNSFHEANSYGTDSARWLPWPFRWQMPVPVTLVSGI